MIRMWAGHQREPFAACGRCYELWTHVWFVLQQIGDLSGGLLFRVHIYLCIACIKGRKENEVLGLRFFRGVSFNIV